MIRDAALLRPRATSSLCRRDLLARCGTGLGLLRWRAYARMMPRAGDSPALDPLRPQRPHFAARARHVVHLFMNGGPSHVDTFDPKPMLDKYHGKPLPTPNLRTERKTGARHALALQVPASTASAASKSANCSRGRPRHIDDMCDHPLDARRRAQPRTVADADELRRRPAAAAEHRVVGHLRAGQREPEPAGLHRHVPRRLSDRRRRRTGGRLSCPAPTRGPTSTRSTRDIDKLIENIRNTDVLAESSAGSSICVQPAQRAATCSDASDDAAAGGPHPVLRAGLPHAERGDATRST